MNNTTTMHDWTEHLREEWEKGLALIGLLVLTITQAKKIHAILRAIGNFCMYPFTVANNLTAAVTNLNGMLDKLNGRMDSLQAHIVKVGYAADGAHELSRAGFESSTTAHFECNALTGECVWTNTALNRMFGISREQALGFGWQAALHPDDIEATREQWDATVKNWRPYRARYRLLTGGKEILVEAKAEVLHAPDGKALTIWGRIDIV